MFVAVYGKNHIDSKHHVQVLQEIAQTCFPSTSEDADEQYVQCRHLSWSIPDYFAFDFLKYWLGSRSVLPEAIAQQVCGASDHWDRVRFSRTTSRLVNFPFEPKTRRDAAFFASVKDLGNPVSPSLVFIQLESTVPPPMLIGRDIAWSKRIIGYLALRVGLVTANAYISTMGGGHFLCRQIDHAEKMALKQYRVAQTLGDDGLMAQCRIHLIYNLIQRGRLRHANLWLRWEWRHARSGVDDQLIGMIRACDCYMRKVHAKRHELRKQKSKFHETVTDQFARQRFVR